MVPPRVREMTTGTTPTTILDCQGIAHAAAGMETAVEHVNFPLLMGGVVDDFRFHVAAQVKV